MSALSTPLFSNYTLRPLDDYPAILLLDVHFDASQFAESLFSTLNITPPAHLIRAVKKRRAEYLVSRYCIQQAMQTLGIEDFVLRNGEDRAPVWPEGIGGSLSHTQHRVCALLTRERGLLLGVDCERLMTAETAAETQHMLINAAEKRMLEQCSLPFNLALTVVFSLKESLYKALYPQLLQFMDFSAAQVVACSDDLQQLTLRLTHTFSTEMVAGREFTGRAQVQPDEVLTWVVGQQ